LLRVEFCRRRGAEVVWDAPVCLGAKSVHRFRRRG
jgi:hypothetical protein